MDDNPQARASDLERLAQTAKLAPFTAAESELLKKASTGNEADCRFGGHDDPENADKWRSDRQIRAEFLAWLCTNEHAQKHIPTRGIQVRGADITGPLHLSFVKTPFVLSLAQCRLETVVLINAEVSLLNLRGSVVAGISADGLVVKNDVLLRNGFKANGEVRLPGAQIGGNLDCSAGSFMNEGDTAINAEGVNVKGSVFLCKGWDPQGKETPFIAKGEVSLNGAQIGGQVNCAGGVFSNSSGSALTAEHAIVKSSVLLTYGFKADGWVVLGGAQIGGNFNCQGGDFQHATLVLTDASAATLRDSGLNDPAGPLPDRTVWPPGDKSLSEKHDDKKHYLLLDGFTYGRIASDGRISVNNRLDWLARQPQSPFLPRPYLQLAKVLRESGDDNGAKQVLIDMEAGLRGGSILSLVLKWTVGYGYDPLLAFWWAGGLTALGWIIYRRSYLAGGMAPTDKDACAKFREPGALIQGHYPSFSPLIYSMENSLPLVKLGQADMWRPDPEPDHPRDNQLAPKLGYRGSWRWRVPKSQSQSAASGSALGENAVSATVSQVGTAAAQGSTSISVDGGTSAAVLLARVPEPPPNPWPRPFAVLEHLLIALGLRRSIDVNHTPSFLSRLGTSPRFVTGFLWFQVLLGWLLATLFVAGVSGIVHK